MTRIAILGAGKIGESLLAGLLSSGWTDIVVTGRRQERIDELHERYGVAGTLSNVDAARGADVVVLAAKPQDLETLLEEVGAQLTGAQTVLSVAAAIPTASIERHLADGVAVVRAMPNAPATVHEGMAGSAPARTRPKSTSPRPRRSCATSAASSRVREEHMDAVTAVSGSGPAYFALLAEAMIEAGLLLGLSREVSTSSSSRRCSARRSCCATRRCTRSSCARRSPRRAERRSPRSTSSSRPACARRS